MCTTRISGSDDTVPCPDITDKIYEMYFPNEQKKLGHFGVILGPSGSGKSVATRDLCEKHPKGVLYVDIVEPNVFHKDLATCIGMKLQPNNIEDLTLGHVPAEYTGITTGCQKHWRRGSTWQCAN